MCRSDAIEAGKKDDPCNRIANVRDGQRDGSATPAHTNSNQQHFRLGLFSIVIYAYSMVPKEIDP